MKDDFLDIYNETYPIVLRLVISKIDNISNVKDIVQNVFMSFYKTYKKNNISNYKALIIDITKKEIFKYYRKREKNLFVDIDFSILENTVKSGVLVETEFINMYNREMVWKEIKKLDLETQKILVLHYLEEMTISDISKLLNINENTVKTKIYRAISKLKERMDILEGDF